MKTTLVLLSLILSTSIFGQVTKKDATKIQRKILELIQSKRNETGATDLIEDQKLYATAKLQADYLSKLDTLSIFQKTGKNKTIEGRLKSSKAEYETGMQYLYAFPASKGKLMTECLNAIQQTISEAENKMISPDFDHIGFAWSLRKKDKATLLSIVIARTGYTVTGQLSKNAFGLRPITKDCGSIFEHNELNHLINSTYIQDNEVFINYNNKSDFEVLFPGPNDGIAIDLINYSQINCNGYNRFDKSKLYDGILLKPIYRNELLAVNTSAGDFRIQTSIGKIPDQFSEEHNLQNIIYIRNGIACNYQVVHYINAANYELKKLTPTFDFHFKPLVITGSVKTKELNFTFEPGQTTPKGNIPKIEKDSLYFVEIYSYSSIDGNDKINTTLHEKRAAAIQQQVENKIGKINRPIKYHVSENWEKCYLQLEALGLDSVLTLPTDQIRLFVLNDTKHNWDSLLAEQRISTLILHYKGTRDSVINPEEFLEMNIRTALLNGNLEQANKAMYILYKSGIQSSILLEKGVLDRIQSEQALVQNSAALLCLYKNHKDIRIISFVRNWLRNPENLDKSTRNNLIQLYNLSTFTLIEENWDISNHQFVNILNPKRIEYLFPDSSIHSEFDFNYYLTRLNFYDLTGERQQVKQSFNTLKNYLLNQSLSDSEVVQLCLFFNNWSDYGSTIEVLKNRLKQANLSPQLALILAQTAVSIDNEIESEITREALKKVTELNQDKWCEWLHFDFQLLRNNALKQYYCESCGY